MKKVKLLGVGVSSTSPEEVLETVVHSVQSSRKLTIFTPNPEILVATKRDKSYARVLNSADIAIPDGVGILQASFFLRGSEKLTRIQGRELVLRLFELSARRKWRVFLLGSMKATNEASLKRLRKEFPGLKAKGAYGLQVNVEGEAETRKDEELEKDTIRKINKFKPHILLVAFGAPKQEKWIYKNLPNLSTNVVMAVGGSLDYFSGEASPPPRWMARVGLEWLWRLAGNPTRIGRIFTAVTVFPLMILLFRRD